MIRLGVTANIYPSVVYDSDYVFEVHVSTWEDGKCMGTRVITNRIVVLAEQPSGEKDNDLWTLDLLEMCSQIVQHELNPAKLSGIIPPDAKPLDTTGKPLSR